MIQKLILLYLRHFPIPFFKVRLANLVKINPDTPPFVFKSSNGILFRLYLDQYLMRNIYLYGESEKNTLFHLKKLVTRGNVVIDVGANIGSYTLNLAKLVNNHGTVYAFEPLKINFERLEENVRLNGFQNIKCLQKGVSDKNGEAIIRYGSKKSGASMIDQTLPNIEKIDIVKLDDFIFENGLTNIDVVKIDVEGAEWQVMMGAEKLFKESKSLIVVMECMEHLQHISGSTNNRIFDKMKEFGFKAFLPKPWPRRILNITKLPEGYNDNVIFIK